jgi:hypothetical protein
MRAVFPHLQPSDYDRALVGRGCACLTPPRLALVQDWAPCWQQTTQRAGWQATAWRAQQVRLQGLRALPGSCTPPPPAPIGQPLCLWVQSATAPPATHLPALSSPLEPLHVQRAPAQPLPHPPPSHHPHPPACAEGAAFATPPRRAVGRGPASPLAHWHANPVFGASLADRGPGAGSPGGEEEADVDLVTPGSVLSNFQQTPLPVGGGRRGGGGRAALWGGLNAAAPPPAPQLQGAAAAAADGVEAANIILESLQVLPPAATQLPPSCLPAAAHPTPPSSPPERSIPAASSHQPAPCYPRHRLLLPPSPRAPHSTDAASCCTAAPLAGGGRGGWRGPAGPGCSPCAAGAGRGRRQGGQSSPRRGCRCSRGRGSW